MALVLKDRCKETTTTTGTGTVTLAGASTGFQALSAVGNGNTTYYCIASQTLDEWEVGVGTYTLAGTLLSRDTVLSSSNAGSLVTFSAGTKDVFVTYPSATASGGATGAGGDTVFQENSMIVTTSYTLTTAKSASSVGPITINGGVAVTIPSGSRWVIL